MQEATHTLIAVLDWGLGHASRCVPLIRQWQAEGQHVVVASSGSALQLLRIAVPDCEWIELPAYRITYPSNNMVWNMARQVPHIAKVVWQEHYILRHYCQQQKVARVVSDGRFGCFDNKKNSIWMAHQLQIQHANVVVRRLANALYHAWVRRHFGAVWIPDVPTADSLAGNLAKPLAGLSTTWLGPLSRFANQPTTASETTYNWVAILSGPEPQRTRLEEKILQQLPLIPGKHLLIRGVPGDTHPTPLYENIDSVDWLTGDDLHARVMAGSKLICRSGYSTLMDLHYWKKRALLIPTPGQTEQVYLAQYWQQMGWAKWQPQDELDIMSAELL
ncbi:MAG: hypothetical protein R2795_02045 [Saprospiraceae bacterium]